MSSNYRTRAILRLRKLSERRRNFLLGLETITRDGDGWREVGLDVLAWCAGLSETTAVRARDDLVTSGLVEYRRGGGGRGDTAPTVSRRRSTTTARAPRKKVVTTLTTFPAPVKVVRTLTTFPSRER